MSKINSKHIFTSESVSEGHPDKVCDQISDAILDACLGQDKKSRVACETMVKNNLIILGGEITSEARLNYEDIVREVLRKIGYNDSSIGFDSSTASIISCLCQQSKDISQGVDEGSGAYSEQGAGDQGIMFGYACDETEEFMPATLIFSHKILQKLAEYRKSGKYPFLRPDSKSQVSLLYEGGKIVRVTDIVVSHQHTEEAKQADLLELVKKVVSEIIPRHLLGGERYLVNPTGRFVIGGPVGDCGLTGRKIIVDTYGGVGSHGGGAFSGKDPSKVDRSAAYLCRYIAKNIVASNLASKCEVQLSYAIGYPEPISINLATYGSSAYTETQLVEAVKAIFPLKPYDIVQELSLLNPEGWSYFDTASYGHFGRNNFPWEKLDKVDEIKNFLEQ